MKGASCIIGLFGDGPHCKWFSFPVQESIRKSGVIQDVQRRVLSNVASRKGLSYPCRVVYKENDIYERCCPVFPCLVYTIDMYESASASVQEYKPWSNLAPSFACRHNPTQVSELKTITRLSICKHHRLSACSYSKPIIDFSAIPYIP